MEGTSKTPKMGVIKVSENKRKRIDEESAIVK